MAIQVQLRRGTATQNNAFTGAIGELSFDTTNNQIRVHDGSTAGGFKIGTGDFPTGTANVALGNTALDSLDGSSPGGNNVAVGHNALTANTTASFGVAVGSGALAANTTGANNVAVGSGALATSTTATDNTALGYQALNANTSGADNVAVGDEAGHDITTGSRNVIVGSKAGDAATTTDDTTLVGYGAGGGAIMTGHDNVAVGSGSLSVTTSGAGNVAIGKDALTANTTASNNVAIGTSALTLNTTGEFNTAVGYQALDAQTTTSYNTAIGYQSMSANTTGDGQTAVGFQSLLSNTTGTQNSAQGWKALYSNTTGNYNTAVGFEALLSNTTADYGTAVGYEALASNTTGAANTAVGYECMEAVTTGTRNTGLGMQTGHDLTTGGYNTYLGNFAGEYSTTGSYNTCVGDASGSSFTTGSSNTFIGQQAGNAVSTGAKNTVLGRYNGNQNHLDIRTDTNNIVLSDGDGNNRLHCTGSVWYAGNLTSNKYWPVVGNVSGANGCSLDGVNGTIGASSTGSPMYINKNNGDGTLLLFYSEGGFEGSVTVSGSTVSYNGGHLARWSQFTDGSRDNTLLKGTVMTNLDQMCVWEHDAVAEGDTIKNALGQDIVATENDVTDAYTENNEQLNCMAVSSVEGDPNVAGVFVDWDDQDDGYNDLRIAMTGDMVIRIAQGVTVARGDLLMSAGDGTAKPQGDDIVRSKTIAKVTSTNVSNTYDDGSYVVPCVLMAC